MTNWIPELQETRGPRYRAIADAIAAAIEAGTLSAGMRLPPQRDLAWRLGVTVGTVGRAYALAEQRGLVAGEVGRGTYVRDAGRAPDAEPLTAVEEAGGGYDLGINMIALPIQADALAETLRSLADRVPVARLLPYMTTGGRGPIREAIARWAGRSGVRAGAEQVLLTCGAQHALTIALSGLARPGEPILTEALTYCGIVDTAGHSHVVLEPVAIDGEGMLPDALDRAARAKGARLVVVTPTVHNPTTAIMSVERRRAIAEVARAQDLILVEDDVYGPLVDDRPPALASFAPERTVYLSSASKCLAPGLRAGWLLAPPPLVPALTRTAHASALAQPALTHEIVRLWLEDGTADRLVTALRAEIGARQAIAAEQLAGLTVRAHPAAFHLLLTVPPPWRVSEFAAAAMSEGIRVIPASSFAVGQAAAPHAVRLSLTAVPSREVLAKALARLAALARSPGGMRGVI